MIYTYFHAAYYYSYCLLVLSARKFMTLSRTCNIFSVEKHCSSTFVTGIEEHQQCKIWGFCRGVVEAFSVQGCCTAQVGSWSPTFRDSQSVPSLRAKQSQKDSSWTANYQSAPRDIPEDRRSWRQH